MSITTAEHVVAAGSQRGEWAGSETTPPLWRSFSWAFAGNLVYTGCQWGMLVLLAKIGSPELVGQFALGLAITAPVFMLANLQLRAIQATDARGTYRFGDYFALRLITTGLAWLIVAGLVLAGGHVREATMVVLVVALAKGFEAISDVFYGHFQGRERMDRVAVSSMIKGPLSLAALAGGIALSGRLVWGVLGLALAWALVLLAYDLPAACADPPEPSGPRSPVEPCWDAPRLLQLAWSALPLGLVMMLISLSTNVPRYFIAERLGERELGLFAAMAYLMVAGNTIVGALGQAASPRLARDFAAGRVADFQARLARLLMLGVVGGGMAIATVAAAGRPILAALYTPDYARRADVFLWLTVAAAIGGLASFLGYAMTAARQFWAQAPIFAGVVAVAAAACALLVPAQGLAGAAQACVIAAIVQLAGSAFVIYRAAHKAGGAPAWSRRSL
jgi:O-antigen/teichoic acid export membrane protein